MKSTPCTCPQKVYIPTRPLPLTRHGLFLIFALLALLGFPAGAQVLYNGTTYTQNFDTFPAVYAGAVTNENNPVVDGARGLLGWYWVTGAGGTAANSINFTNDT